MSVILEHLDGTRYKADQYEVTDRNFFLFIISGTGERVLRYVVPIMQTHHIDMKD